MIRKFACIALGAALMVTGSWWGSQPADTLGDEDLSAIRGRDIMRPTINQACEYATIEGTEVLAAGGCAGKANGTICVQCKKNGAGLNGINYDGGFYSPGSRENGQVNCNTFDRRNGHCLNGACVELMPADKCKNVMSPVIEVQPTQGLP